MLYKIKNQYLTAYIETFGAQLIRLIDKDNINRLHEASEKTWEKVSPILFPQISRTKGYIYKATNIETKMTHYEVFVRKYNKRFNNICYPSSKAFGIWAWTFHDLEKAITKFNLINKENYEI